MPLNRLQVTREQVEEGALLAYRHIVDMFVEGKWADTQYRTQAVMDPGLAEQFAKQATVFRRRGVVPHLSVKEVRAHLLYSLVTFDELAPDFKSSWLTRLLGNNWIGRSLALMQASLHAGPPARTLTLAHAHARLRVRTQSHACAQHGAHLHDMFAGVRRKGPVWPTRLRAALCSFPVKVAACACERAKLACACACVCVCARPPVRARRRMSCACAALSQACCRAAVSLSSPHWVLCRGTEVVELRPLKGDEERPATAEPARAKRAWEVPAAQGSAPHGSFADMEEGGAETAMDHVWTFEARISWDDFMCVFAVLEGWVRDF